jgi:hypothetical protein
MYIDDAIANAVPATGTLANNAPDVVVRYVQRLTAGDNSDFVMRVAKEAAKQLLSERFVPRPMAKADLLDKLKSKFQGEPVEDALSKLVNAGIVSESFVAGAILSHFTHDPVAEFLASIRYCEELAQRSRADWEAFLDKVRNTISVPNDFVFALRTCLASYRSLLGLPEHMRLDSAIADQGKVAETTPGPDLVL